MNISARFLALALLAVPAVPALAATPAAAAPAKAGPVLVARYTFDGGAVAGKVAEVSGRGVPLTLRSAHQGTVRFPAAGAGKYAGLPTRCAKTVAACPKALLQGADDPDLDPGTSRFTWAASIRVAKTQLAGSANVMQKGVATTESQWKMQVGLKNGRAQCVVVGRGSAKAYVARSTAGVADGAWHKILCVRSGALLSVYVDGAVKGSTAVPAAMSILNDKPLRIGGPNFHTVSDMFHGDVDDVYAQLG